MIRCKKCGYIGEYKGPFCPTCKERYTFTAEQIEEKLAEIRCAMESRDYEVAEEGYRILADMGHVESQREYASILERGEIVSRDLDRAMNYFHLAAEKNDAYSAYRYSLLAERTSEKAARFWLSFAAVLGCSNAYPALADKLSKEKDDATANYYYGLAAACDDVDSIVTLAKRYFVGIGTERNEAYAKWYMDKLTLPPIHSLKMAYKLRSVKAEEPPMPTHPDYDGMLHRLASVAKGSGYLTAYCRLCSILSDRGDIPARVALGMMYAEGKGVRQNTERALSLLCSAATHGSAEAYRHLGDIYLSGDIVEQDTNRALDCYRGAAKSGMTNAYETMGDIYLEGSLVKKDIPEAIRLYDLAAKEGHSGAREKSDSLKKKREYFFTRGLMEEKDNPEEAFRLYAIATGMGYLPAVTNLARCFEMGIGTEVDRKRAFMWYKTAAEERDTDALYLLGLCYSRGIGTAFNFHSARSALTLAVKQGHKEAESELVRLLENKKKHMTRTLYSRAMRLIHMKKFAEAKDALEPCLRLKYGKGIYTLGCMYEFGLGVPTDRSLAFSLYETAFSLKFRDPRANYKLSVLKRSRED